MDNSTLYDLLNENIIKHWREEAETEMESYLTDKENLNNELLKVIPKDSQNLLKDFRLAIEESMDHVNYCLLLKTLNYGIKIGMELQKSFEEFEY